MSVEIENAIKVTQQAFVNGVWPEIASMIGGGKIIPVEAVSNKEFLDMYSGIDHWHVIENRNLIRGIASRCQQAQKIGKRWETFTIRTGNSQREYAKRIYALENSDSGWLRPHLFVQAFFLPGTERFTKFWYAEVAKMDDILRIIRDRPEGRKNDPLADWWLASVNADGKPFYVVPWSTLTRLELQFRMIDAPPE